MNAWQNLVLENGQVVSVKVTVILCVAIAVEQLARRAASAWRHAIWASAVSTCLVILFAGNLLPNLHLIPSDWLLFQEASTPTTTSRHVKNDTSDIPVITASGQPRLIRAHADIHQSETASPPEINTWLCRIWLVGACLGVARLLVSCGRMQWMIRSGRETENQHLADLAATTATHLGLKQTPQLKVNSNLCVPLAVGVFRPVVVVGANVESMAEVDQRHVLFHEQGHLKRSDPLWQWVLGLAQSVFWFHPLMWYASYRMTTLREYACDDLVISQTDAPQSYASLLVAIAGRVRRTTSTAIAVTMTSARPTERRIRRLFKTRMKQEIPSGSAIGASIAAVVTIGLVTSLLRTTNAATQIDAPAPSLSVEQPAVATGTSDTGKNEFDRPAKVDVTFVVAEHAIVHVDGDSRRVVSEDEVIQIIRDTARDAIVKPHLAITHNGMFREKSLVNRAMKLHSELYKVGRSEGVRIGATFQRSREYWDRVRTNDDLLIRAVDQKQGRVTTSDGDPVDGAQVLVLPRESTVYLAEARVRNPLDENVVNTDAAGCFRISPRDGDEYWIAALHPKGFVIQVIEHWHEKSLLQLQPWAEVHGNVFGTKPEQTKETHRLSEFPLLITSRPVPGTAFSISGKQTNTDGRFHQRFIPPGDVQVGRSYVFEKGESVCTSEFQDAIRPAENKFVDLVPGTPPQLLKNIELLNRLRNQ